MLNVKTIDNFINKILCGDSLSILSEIPPDSIDLIVTSPPYFGCRVYGNQDEGLGRESSPLEYINNLYDYTQQFKRVLKPNGSLYIIIGDVYFGCKGFSRNKGKWSRKTDNHYKKHDIEKPDGAYLQYKQLLMLPDRLAIKMQDSGKWILRADIIWEKPNPIPSHSNDRVLPVYEHIFHFVKEQKYFFDYKKIKEMNRHRNVIRNNIEPYKKHQATFPESLVEPYILATSKENDIIMDPFGGSGTVATVAMRNNRRYISIDIVPEYCKISEKRVEDAKNYKNSKEELFGNTKNTIPETKKRNIFDEI